MLAYFERCLMRLLRPLALSLGLPMTFLPASDPMEALRLLHYSAQKSDTSSGVWDAASARLRHAHASADRRRARAGDLVRREWILVPPRPNCFIVNLGDMLRDGRTMSIARLCIESPTPGGAHSIPFFFEPNFDCVVSCLTDSARHTRR